MRPDLTQTFSFSRIQAFTQCKRFYKHRYIDRVPVEGTEGYFVLGKAYHEGLEHLYRNYEGKLLPAQDQITQLVVAGLDGFWQGWFNDELIGDLWYDFKQLEQDAITLNHLTAELLWRSSAECRDPKLWIRNKDGSLYKAPQMSKAWEKAAAELRIPEHQAKVNEVAKELDEAASSLSPTLLSSNFNLSAVVLESYALGRLYTDFEGTVEVVGVERGFWDDHKLQQDTRLILDQFKVQGFIDLIVNLDGKLTIIDHKTSKALIDPLGVLYHEQLNLYAYAVKEAFGFYVQQIGINHARTNTKIIVPVDWTIVEQVVERQRQHLQAIEAEVTFPVQNPLDTYAAKKCLGYSRAPYLPENLSGVCPYLPLCHPALAAHLESLAQAAAIPIEDTPPFTIEPSAKLEALAKQADALFIQY